MKPSLVWLTLLAACDGGSASSGVGLSIDSATSAASINAIQASAGHSFIIIELTMNNTGAKVPLSINPVLFSLSTDQSLDYLPSAAQPSDGCDPSVSVGSGGKMQCEIAFEVPNGHKPTTLAYNDQHGDTASVPVPAVAQISPACQAVSGWLGNLSGSCPSCIAMATGSGGGCSNQQAAYRASCAACSQQCNTNFATLCTCEAGCDTTSCETLFANYMMCLDSACQLDCR